MIDIIDYNISLFLVTETDEPDINTGSPSPATTQGGKSSCHFDHVVLVFCSKVHSNKHWCWTSNLETTCVDILRLESNNIA